MLKEFSFIWFLKRQIYQMETLADILLYSNVLKENLKTFHIYFLRYLVNVFIHKSHSYRGNFNAI